jgi:ubiquinone/menaquinone biosynthesis C-methylase UbiE
MFSIHVFDPELEKKVLKYEEKSLPFYLDMIKLAGVKPGYMVLDVGCGGCPLTRTKKDYTLVGLDCDDALLEIAAARNGASLVKGDARTLPFKDDSFDSVIMVSLPQDTPNYSGAVREMARVLKPGRKMAIIEDIYIITGRTSTIKYLLRQLGFYGLVEESSGIVYCTKPGKLNEIPLNIHEISEELYPK